MNPRGRGRPKSDPARDLRGALLATSRELLDEAGPSALSMREVARRAGCTHQAPYHYFPNREAILAELVRQGFDELASRLDQARAESKPTGKRATLIASAEAYVGFALEHPGVFRMMFRPDMYHPNPYPDVNGHSAYAELERLTRIVFGEAASLELATILWAHVHGISCLLIDGPPNTLPPAGEHRDEFIRGLHERFGDSILPKD